MTTPPGWYDDPERPGTQRYWDGTAWAAPTAPTAPTAPPVAPQRRSSSTRMWLIIGGAIALVILLLVGGCAVIAGNLFSRASDAIDPARNSQTGLPDGSYTLTPNMHLTVNDRCSFSGTPYTTAGTPAVASSVTVVGAGTIQCGTTGPEAPEVRTVMFTVSGGTATITGVEQPPSP